MYCVLCIVYCVLCIVYRAGQVPYSKAKAMMDFALSRLSKLPATICCLGMIYSSEDGSIGQTSSTSLNLKDLALLPLTPIMGENN